MNAKEFADELDKIKDKAWNDARELVFKAQKDEGLEFDTDKALSIANDPNWQYKADGLAELGGWIYDRLNGRNRLHKKSMTKKIRKALGFTYP